MLIPPQTNFDDMMLEPLSEEEAFRQAESVLGLTTILRICGGMLLRVAEIELPACETESQRLRVQAKAAFIRDFRDMAMAEQHKRSDQRSTP